ncbi:MAG: Ig-like domain-containing protein, partial [Methanobrevibacter sp.]|nr:Ig-like domain-containing protein [Methanobrevibacter sp.]
MKINKKYSILIFVLIFALLVSLSAVSANQITNETVDSTNDEILSVSIEDNNLENLETINYENESADEILALDMENNDVKSLETEKEVTIDANDITMDYGGDESLTATVTCDGESVEVPVAITVNGDARDNMTSVGGQITLDDLKTWNAGTYTVNFTVNTDEYKGNKTVTVLVAKATPSFTVENIEVDIEGIGFIIPKDVVADENYTFTYSSSDESLVTVVNQNGDGRVYGVNLGVAKVTVTLNESKNYFALSKSVNVTVTRIATTIIVDQPNILLETGKSKGSGARIHPNNAGKLNYVSSNTTVAYIVNDIIHANRTGNAVITVSFAGNDRFAAAEDQTINVTVIGKKVVTIDASDVSMTYGDDESLTATVTYDGDNVEVPVAITVNGDARD